MTEAITRMYEGMFLVDAGANWDGVMDAVNSTLSRANAEIASLRKWDECRLAYPIGQCTRGTYILSYFRADPQVITGIERDVVLSEILLRAMILRADRIPQAVIDSETPATRIEREKKEGEAARAAQAEAKAQAEATEDDAPTENDPVLAAPEPVGDAPLETPQPAAIEPLVEDVSDAPAPAQNNEDQDSDTVTPPPA